MKLGPDVQDALRIGLRHREDQEELHVVSYVCLVTSASAKVHWVFRLISLSGAGS
jgi:hypothetical protein